jgi:hypothetical protein
VIKGASMWLDADAASPISKDDPASRPAASRFHAFFIVLSVTLLHCQLSPDKRSSGDTGRF